MKNNRLSSQDGAHSPVRLRAPERHLTELTRTLRFRDLSELACDADWHPGCEDEGSPVIFARIEH